MQRRKTFGGKDKYVFEPKVDSQQAPSPGPAQDLQSAKTMEEPAPPTKKRSEQRKRVAAKRAEAGLCQEEQDTGAEALDMDFRHEDSPQSIRPVKYECVSFYEDTQFIMELPDAESGEFVVYTDGSCAVISGSEEIKLTPVSGAPMVAVDIEDSCVNELGVVTQSYVV